MPVTLPDANQLPFIADQFPRVSTRKAYADAVREAQMQAGAIKALAQRTLDDLEDGLEVSRLFEIRESLIGAEASMFSGLDFDDPKVVSGLQAYTVNGMGADLMTGFLALVAEMRIAAAALLAAVPVSADGSVREHSLGEFTGYRVPVIVPEADLTDVGATLQALADRVA